MGYFPNGTAGEIYYEQWCSRCIHEREIREGGDGPGCAVWGAHLFFNYDECNNDASILDFLIPRNGLDNTRCTMFHQDKKRPKPQPIPLKGTL